MKAYFDRLETAQQVVGRYRKIRNRISKIEHTLSQEPKTPEGVQEETASTVTNTLESSETMVPKKVRNLGAPPEGSGITIVTETRKLSDTVPECAERNGFWRYNRLAFDQLVKMWVLRILTREQLLAHINVILPGDVVAKAKAMNGEDEPFPGFLFSNNGKVSNRGLTAVWWVISSDGSLCVVALNCFKQYACSSSLFIEPSAKFPSLKTS